VHAVLGPLHAFVLLLPAIFVAHNALAARPSLPLPQTSWLPLEVGQAGAQGPHEAPPGGGTSAITLLAVQLATQLQCATSQTIALNCVIERRMLDDTCAKNGYSCTRSRPRVHSARVSADRESSTQEVEHDHKCLPNGSPSVQRSGMGVLLARRVRNAVVELQCPRSGLRKETNTEFSVPPRSESMVGG